MSVLAITLGDPYSIHLEVLLPLLYEHRSQHCSGYSIGIFGCHEVFVHEVQKLASKGLVNDDEARAALDARVAFDMALADHNSQLSPPTLAALDQCLRDLAGGIAFINTTAVSKLDPHKMSPRERGWIAHSALKATSYVSEMMTKDMGRFAVLTAPIHKYEARLAHFTFDGQTEYFEDIWNQQGIMVLAGRKLKVGLMTNHLPLREVVGRITKELVVAKTLAFIKTLRFLASIEGDQQSLGELRVAMCGINPHLSDGGLFGNEEALVLRPAMERVRKSVEIAAGKKPHVKIQLVLEPADSAFFKAIQGNYHGVLACYHDQGLGPLKAVDFDSAINITGGLDHLRVSPDHGPARDLYHSGKASSTSFRRCLEVCHAYLSGPFDSA